MPNFEALMKTARETNRRRDDAEHQVGYAGPSNNIAQIRAEAIFSTDLKMLLRTASLAIECGIRTDDWNAVAEGLAMLDDAAEEIISRPAFKKGN